MIGFKKVPTKAISIIFFISILLILLLYTDLETYDALPVEEIEISEDIQEQLPEMPTYMMHEVQDGENLSIIFEEFKVPLNTAYKIFRLDSQNLLAYAPKKNPNLGIFLNLYDTFEKKNLT